MRFSMRFSMRFRVQNAPHPARMMFGEASCGLERKWYSLIWRPPLSITWRYFVTALRDQKHVRGRPGQALHAQNGIKIAYSKIACVSGPLQMFVDSLLCLPLYFRSAIASPIRDMVNRTGNNMTSKKTQSVRKFQRHHRALIQSDFECQ